jgi:hypothetical protein
MREQWLRRSFRSGRVADVANFLKSSTTSMQVDAFYSVF